MNESVVQSSPAQHTVVAGNPNWWSINNMRPNHHQNRNSFLSGPPPPPLLTTTSPWNDSDELPESWSQLLLGGLCGEEVKMDNWEKHILNEYSSPKASCVTSLSGSNMLDFSHKSVAGKLHHLHPDPSSHECTSRATGGPANKKVRIQPPNQAQSTFKVRKEKLGDRIAALHQLVSPFGKTDTASVLLEAIGYIRFLQSQVEALSLPYLDNGSRNISHQHSVEGEMNYLFPEDPGQEKTDKEARKDLRSRGLCLVPISCTHHIGNENGADYWAFGGNLQ